MKKRVLKFGFPSESLRDQTIKLFETAGYKVNFEQILQQLEIDDPEIDCILSRTQEITRTVEKGMIDAGITEKAFIIDHKVDIIEIANLNYGNNIWEGGKIVLAVPEDSKIHSIRNLGGKKILARVPEITKEYLKKYNVKASVEWTDNPAESKVPLLGDAIVEFTNTGNTFKAFNLRIVDVVIETSPILFVNKKAFRDKWKREKIENLAILLRGARLAKEYSGVMLHVPKNVLKKVLLVLPALKKPTITPLQDPSLVDVFTVMPKKDLRQLIPTLKKIGCADIAEFSLNKVVL